MRCGPNLRNLGKSWYSSQVPTRLPRGRRVKEEVRFNFIDNPFDPSPVDEDAASFPLLNAKQLAKYEVPPRRFQTLTRDFIHDSLYNPHYGYFTQQAVIFDSDRSQPGSFDFNAIPNSAAFDRQVAARYNADRSTSDQDNVSTGTTENSARQLWHTPTELFKPYYAQAVARFLVDSFKQSPSSELVIYEVGAGNGTLMQGILDDLATSEPEIYAKTSYNTIEISPRLAALQKAKGASHGTKVTVLDADVLELQKIEERPCFVLAFEVLDNLAHDMVRFTRDPSKPVEAVQCSISVSTNGDFNEQYTTVYDPLVKEFLEAHEQTQLPPLEPARSQSMRTLMAAIPFSANLSPPVFLPTQLLRLLKTLKTNFPRHKLLLSDFHALPDTIPGKNGPVVQTRYMGETVPCTTYLVQQGFFDIFFPTDFQLLQKLYEHVVGSGKLECATHSSFLQKWADAGKTRLKNGDNPMLDFYANASFAWSREAGRQRQ